MYRIQSCVLHVRGLWGPLEIVHASFCVWGKEKDGFSLSDPQRGLPPVRPCNLHPPVPVGKPRCRDQKVALGLLTPAVLREAL